MIRIASSCLSKVHKLIPTTVLHFSKRAKQAQLILHSPEQIENMITRLGEKRANREEKKGWRNAEDKSMFRVSLVGLPNCGKSSLFNCLIGERVAVVDKQRGTTRDRK
jgi:tRNA U34 5-carboxymethylaminomethyl modifying GTPase MnmE/TrmE